MATTADFFNEVLNELMDEILDHSGNDATIGSMMLLEVLRQVDPDCTFKLIPPRTMRITFSDDSTVDMTGRMVH